MTLAQAWQVPPYGEPAKEPLPTWLIDKLNSGDILINSYGLTGKYETMNRAIPGDYVVLTEYDKIEFMNETVFLESFEPLQQAA